MNEELTNEALEVMAGCEGCCSPCEALGVCTGDRFKQFNILAAALLEERAKPNDDVWKNAPDWAISAVVFWESQAQRKRMAGPVFTRELPKTRARQIAEQEGHGLAEKYGWNASAKELVTNVMESALTKYAEELTNTKETN